jgi:predicted nucleic acid-binding protein
MYLVDTSVWIDHLRQSDPMLVKALGDDLVACHPFIIGELALGSLKDRKTVIAMLENLPSVTRADDSEVLRMIEDRKLFARGLGLIDAHLLAAALIEGDVQIWTKDKRFQVIATELNVAASLSK